MQQSQGVMCRTLRKSNSDHDSNKIADNIAVILKESFASLWKRLSQGFNDLGQMFQDNLAAGLMSTESKQTSWSSESEVLDNEVPATLVTERD